MPEDSKGTDSVSPQAEGAKAPGEGIASGKPVVPASEGVKATPAVESKPVEAAKPAPVVAKPAAAAAPAKPAVPAKPAGPVPEPWESELITRLRQQYGSGIVEASRYLGQRYLVVDSSLLQEILLRMPATSLGGFSPVSNYQSAAAPDALSRA